ncbi:MAG TPA: hypothetical protein VNW06_02615, partial [Cytophagaceae bacterium]|nr:hypothetical protein [Cytophagaceae bacterium]
MIPDEKDMRRFKHEVVKHAEVCYNFNERSANKKINVTNWSYEEPLMRLPLEKFLEKQKAKHFLVIKNDSVVFEYTDKKITSYEPSPSFSVAKTFVSAS